MNYEVYGAFDVPRKRSARGQWVLDLTAEAQRGFWREVDGRVPGLPDALGCYLFSIRAGGGIRPWYVGQTTRAFRRECFTADKQNVYHEVLNDMGRGTPILLFVARRTDGGGFSRAVDQGEVDFAENLLMQLAYGDNPALRNSKGLRAMRRMVIPGVLNSRPGALSSGARQLRSALGIR